MADDGSNWSHRLRPVSSDRLIGSYSIGMLNNFAHHIIHVISRQGKGKSEATSKGKDSGKGRNSIDMGKPW